MGVVQNKGARSDDSESLPSHCHCVAIDDSIIAIDVITSLHAVILATMDSSFHRTQLQAIRMPYLHVTARHYTSLQFTERSGRKIATPEEKANRHAMFCQIPRRFPFAKRQNHKTIEKYRKASLISIKSHTKIRFTSSGDFPVLPGGLVQSNPKPTKPATCDVVSKDGRLF